MKFKSKSTEPAIEPTEGSPHLPSALLSIDHTANVQLAPALISYLSSLSFFDSF